MTWSHSSWNNRPQNIRAQNFF